MGENSVLVDRVTMEFSRAREEAGALERGDFAAFLGLVRESGHSSWMYLQNIAPAGAVEQHPLQGPDLAFDFNGRLTHAITPFGFQWYGYLSPREKKYTKKVCVTVVTHTFLKSGMVTWWPSCRWRRR